MSEIKKTSHEIGFCGALTLLFVGLKLADIIGWSWWWVLSPLWIPFVSVFIILSIGYVIYLLFQKK